jgi:hypothetical protein
VSSSLIFLFRSRFARIGPFSIRASVQPAEILCF